jgi:hypothetical protein
VAGYYRLMGADEEGTARALRDHRAAADPLVAEHGGRIVKTTGDGLLVEFASVVDAVRCAVCPRRRLQHDKTRPFELRWTNRLKLPERNTQAAQMASISGRSSAGRRTGTAFSCSILRRAWRNSC